jgi:hypothetical protein
MALAAEPSLVGDGSTLDITAGVKGFTGQVAPLSRPLDLAVTDAASGTASVRVTTTADDGTTDTWSMTFAVAVAPEPGGFAHEWRGRDFVVNGRAYGAGDVARIVFFGTAAGTIEPPTVTALVPAFAELPRQHQPQVLIDAIERHLFLRHAVRPIEPDGAAFADLNFLPIVDFLPPVERARFVVRDYHGAIAKGLATIRGRAALVVEVDADMAVKAGSAFTAEAEVEGHTLIDVASGQVLGLVHRGRTSYKDRGTTTYAGVTVVELVWTPR